MSAGSAESRSPVLDRSAVISDCGTWRYRLDREFDGGEDTCCFVMLNPSTADGETDDPTVRRCTGYARDWGFAELSVVNLFAHRCTEPAELAEAGDPVGPDNDAHLRRAIEECDLLVCAWGNRGRLRGRDEEVRKLLKRSAAEPYCLGVTQERQPKHPLYLPRDLEPRAWTGIRS